MSYDHWKATNPADAFLGPEPSHEELVGLYGEEALELAGMTGVVEKLGAAAADTSVRTGAPVATALKAYGRLEAEIILFRSLLDEARIHLAHTGNPNGLAERIAAALKL